MSLLGAMAQKDKGSNLVVPNLQHPPESTGFFQNIGAGFRQAVAGPHSTQNARAIYESRAYDQIVQALNAEGEKATDYVDSPVLRTSPFYHPVEGEQVLPDGRVRIPVQRPFANPFSEGPSLTRDINPVTNFYLGGDPNEIRQMFEAVNRVRKRKPDFLKQFSDPSAIDAWATQQRLTDQETAAQVTSRATTLGSVGSFIGGMAGSIASGDPENFVGGWSGAPGKSIARAIVKRAVEGAAANAAAGTVALPGQEADLERMGQAPMTTGEMVKGVAENAAAGALFGTVHAVAPEAAAAVGQAVGTVVSKVAENLPAPVRDPIVAASIRAGTVKDRDLLYEFQKTHAPYSVVDTSTPTEKAAAHVMTQDVETKEQSPLQPRHDGDNNQRLTAVAQALGVDLAPPEQPTTAPIVAPTAKADTGTRPVAFADAITRAEGSTRNPRSSADGYGNFIDSTWLSVAPHIADTAGMSREQILDLRHDKGIAQKATNYYAAQNGSYLRARGLEDSPGNLSLAHFLGPDGATRLLKAAPDAPVESLLPPEVIHSNHEVLQGKSASEIIAWAHKRIGAAVDVPPARPDAVPDEGYDYASPMPYTVKTLRPEELPPTSAQAPTDEPFNPNLSQHLLVWEATDGRRELIDGGKRLAHARSQEDQNISLPTVVLKESDGIPEEMAALVGKLKNVNLGTASLADAAGALADIPELAAALRSPQFKRDIAAIAQLPYEQFGAAMNGQLDPIAASQISAPAPSARTEKLAEQIKGYWKNQKEGGFRRKPIQVVTTADGEIKTWAATASERYVADKFNPDEGDVITRLRPDDHATLDALISSGHKESGNGTITRTGAIGGGPREPSGGAGRDLAAEAPDANLPRGSEPSLFDQAVTHRQAAEKFSEPAGPEAMQQTALLEHDLRQDAEPRTVVGEVVQQPQVSDLWKVPEEHLQALLDEARLSDRNKLLKALGSEEQVKRFDALNRTMNSMDPRRADEASAAFDREFGTLTPEQERLIYGIGETEAQVDDIKTILSAYSDVIPGDDAGWSAYMAAHAARKVSAADLAKVPKGDGTVQAQAEFIRIGRAYQNLADAGVAPNEIPRRMAEALIGRGGWEPEAAAEIIGAFAKDMADMRGERSAPTPGQRLLEAPESAPEGKTAPDTAKAAKPPENASGAATEGVDPSLHLFDLPETGFRLSEEGNTVSIKEALDSIDADEAAAKALRDCL